MELISVPPLYWVASLPVATPPFRPNWDDLLANVLHNVPLDLAAANYERTDCFKFTCWRGEVSLWAHLQTSGQVLSPVAPLVWRFSSAVCLRDENDDGVQLAELFVAGGDSPYPAFLLGHTKNDTDASVPDVDLAARPHVQLASWMSVCDYVVTSADDFVSLLVIGETRGCLLDACATLPGFFASTATQGWRTESLDAES